MTTLTIKSAAHALHVVQTDLLDMLPYLATRTKDRLGGSATKHLRLAVLDFAGMVCVLCGEPTNPDTAPRDRAFPHLGHLISAEYIYEATGVSKAGYVGGNLSCQHKGCNGDAGTSVIPASALARPDLVPLTIPKVHKYGITQHAR